jgi:2,4-dienoyl-CoA reductase-like NADH-dependent reductase (Old Yellow Enzyme family)/thioredoxin reductase
MATVSDPINIGSLHLSNRYVSAPMVVNAADENGYVTDVLVDYYRRKAKGGWGLVQVEASHVSADDRNFSGMLGIYDDKCVMGLRRIVEAIHQSGGKCSIQPQHSGRQTAVWVAGKPAVAPMDKPTWTAQETHAISETEVDAYIQMYADAALRAQQAGFDAVLIHGAHGFLITQFMSPYTNRRTDRWGDRTLFLSEVIQRVRQSVGPQYPVMIRINADEFIRDEFPPLYPQEDADPDWRGYGIDEFLDEFVPALIKAGVDGIDVSKGNFESCDRLIEPLYYPRGYHVYLAERVKQRIAELGASVPVIAVGRLNDPTLCRSLVEEGRTDLVALGRQALADPDFALKALTGRENEINKCIYCDACTGRLFARWRVHCTVNPALVNEGKWRLGLRRADRPKRVAIVGGGVAGMQTALVAAERGHQVTILEQDGALGGTLRKNAAAIPNLETTELNNLVTSLMRRIRGVGNIEVKTGAAATAADVLAMQPDAVVVATGARTIAPQVPGIDRPKVTDLDQYPANHAQFAEGTRVAVIGGKYGAEAAVSLARKGCKVTLVAEEDVMGVGAAPYASFYAYRQLLLLKFLEGYYLPREGEPGFPTLQHNPAHAVELLTETKLNEVTDDGIRVTDAQGTERVIEADSVFIAWERAANGALYEELFGKVPELYVIGDAQTPRTSWYAVHDGVSVALEL